MQIFTNSFSLLHTHQPMRLLSAYESRLHVKLTQQLKIASILYGFLELGRSGRDHIIQANSSQGSSTRSSIRWPYACSLMLTNTFASKFPFMFQNLSMVVGLRPRIACSIQRYTATTDLFAKTCY